MRRLGDSFGRRAYRPFRFLIVGGAATLTHLLVAGVFLATFPSASAYAANIAAFLVAFLVSFYGHRHITFQVPGSLWRFLFVAIGGFAANNLIVTICLALHVSDLLSIATATISVPALTYLAASLWAFKPQSTAE